MVPINLYLLKVAEFCNLNCSYCFMFNLRDSVHLKKPKMMPLELIKAFAPKAVALAKKQGVSRITLSLHGGEPMLVGIPWMREMKGVFDRAGGEDVEFGFFMQTNGMLVDEAWLDFLEENAIQVGLSMDGPKEVHDRARVDHAGRGSYDQVVRGLELLKQRSSVFSGILCVIDPEFDGLKIYKHFRDDLGVTGVDFLWPLDHNWDHPPPHLADPTATPYADYLIPIFNYWWREDDEGINIRYFRNIVKMLLGGGGELDALGGNPISIVSLDTDGSLEPLDSLKACGDGFTNLGLDIRQDAIESIYRTDLFRAAIAGKEGLSRHCMECPLLDTCGGGYLPHRFSSRNAFDNPTVYCRDMWKLVTHILRVTSDEMDYAKEEGRMDISGLGGAPHGHRAGKDISIISQIRPGRPGA